MSGIRIGTVAAGALSFVFAGSAVLAAKPVRGESLDRLLIGTWDIRGADELDAPCASTFYSRFRPGGIYEDGDGTRGRYIAKGTTLTFLPGNAGKRSTSTLVRKVSRDKLVWANEDGRFGMRRC